MKEMRFDHGLARLNKHTHLLVKFGISFLLVGLAFRLLISDPIRFSSSAVQTVATPPVESRVDTHSPPSLPLVLNPPVNDHNDDGDAIGSIPSNLTAVPANGTDASGYGEQVAALAPPKCDIFTGDWVPDQSGPVYTNKSCPEIEAHQNCMRNGRTDSGYLYWRWRPRDCELRRFDPNIFLNMMRDKSWAFIGDSISRNHVQSLLCILSQVEEAVEVYHDKEYRSKRWHFPAHNVTLSVIWAPFLLKADIFEDINGVSSSEIQLHLDELDVKWTEQYKNFNYAVIAGGKWFLKTAVYHENGTVSGCHYCPGKNLTELGFDYAYRKALGLVLNFITEPEHRAVVFLRTTTPDHFENGEWFSGGTCNRTVPFNDGDIETKDVDTIMRKIELEEFEKAKEKVFEQGFLLKLLDTTRLSLLRPDGHPGPYRQFQPFAEDKNAKVQNDCLHWCLPGPIDSWNDLVMEMLVGA